MKINLIDHGYTDHSALLRKTIESKIAVEYEADGMKIELDVKNMFADAESYYITFEDDCWKIIASCEVS